MKIFHGNADSITINGETIRIGREIQCLPYAGFFFISFILGQKFGISPYHAFGLSVRQYFWISVSEAVVTSGRAIKTGHSEHTASASRAVTKNFTVSV